MKLTFGWFNTNSPEYFPHAPMVLSDLSNEISKVNLYAETYSNNYLAGYFCNSKGDVIFSKRLISFKARHDIIDVVRCGIPAEADRHFIMFLRNLYEMRDRLEEDDVFQLMKDDVCNIPADLHLHDGTFNLYDGYFKQRNPSIRYRDTETEFLYYLWRHFVVDAAPELDSNDSYTLYLVSQLHVCDYCYWHLALQKISWFSFVKNKEIFPCASLFHTLSSYVIYSLRP